MRHQALFICILNIFLFQKNVCQPNTLVCKQNSAVPIYNADYALRLSGTPLFCSRVAVPNYASWFTPQTKDLFAAYAETYCTNAAQGSHYKKELSIYDDTVFDIVSFLHLCVICSAVFCKSNHDTKNSSPSFNYLIPHINLIKELEEKDRADIEIDEAIALERFNEYAARIYRITEKKKTLQKLTKKRILSRL